MSSTGNLDQKQLRAVASQTGVNPVNFPRLTSVPTDSLHPFVTSAGDAKSILHSDLDLQVGGTRVRWVNPYVFGNTYEKNDMVRDGGWTMIANKQTSERASPQPSGQSFYLFTGTEAFTQDTATQIRSGNRFTFDVSAYLLGYRVYAYTGITYRIFLVLDPDGSNEIQELILFTAEATGWQEFNISPVIVTSGSTLEIISIAHETDPTPAEWSADWYYGTPQNPAVPAAGEIVHSRSRPDLMEINYMDDSIPSVSRETELRALQVGDRIIGGGQTWTIQSTNAQASYIAFGVSPASTGISGSDTFTFQTETATPIDYMEVANYWPTTPYTARGYLQVGGNAGQLNDNAYGTDILVQNAVISADWDLVSTSDVSAFSGGDGGAVGPGTVNALAKFTATDEIGDSNLTDDGSKVSSALEVYCPGANIGMPLVTPKLWLWHNDYEVGTGGEPYRLELFLHAASQFAHPSFVLRGPDRTNPATQRDAYVQFDELFIGWPRITSPGGGSPPTDTPQDVFTGLTAIAYDAGQNVFWSWSGSGWSVVGSGGGGGGAVDSVFGRTGVVVAVAGDYTGLLVTFSPASSHLTSTTVQGAIDELAGEVQTNTGDRHTHANKALLDTLTVGGAGDQYLTDDGTYKPITPNPYAAYVTHNYDSAPVFNYGSLTPDTWYRLQTSPLTTDDVLGFTSMATFSARYDGTSRRFKIDVGITVVNEDTVDVELTFAVYVNGAAARTWETTVNPSGKEYRRWSVFQTLNTNDLVEFWFKTPQNQLQLHNAEMVIS